MFVARSLLSLVVVASLIHAAEAHPKYSYRYYAYPPYRTFSYGYTTPGGGSYVYRYSSSPYSYNYRYGYSPYYGGRYSYGYSPYGYDSPYYRRYGYHYHGPPIVLPPLHADASVAYGPGAIGRFLGLNRQSPNRVNQPALEDAPPPPGEERRPRIGNRAVALRFLEFGDKQIRKGEYHAALQRYKKAADADANLADAYFRQALAHFGIRKYTRARTAIQKGLALNPAWPQEQLELDNLLDAAEKEALRQKLVDWLNEHPLDADGHFMLGVVGHFEGEPELAHAAFRRTVELSGIADDAEAFLPKPAEEEVADEQ